MVKSWYSQRFQRRVYLTRHAELRIVQRAVSIETLIDLIESGTIKHKDENYLWIFNAYSSRTDILLCAAVVSGSALIVKTVMTHWQEGAE